jgi:hypothetical protein
VRVEGIVGCYVVRDANGQSLASEASRLKQRVKSTFGIRHPILRTLRLFGNAKDYGRTGSANADVVERDGSLVRNNWSPRISHNVSTENSLAVITGQCATLGTIVAHSANSEIASGPRLSSFAWGPLLSSSSPLALRSSRTYWPLAAAKHCYHEHSN